MTKHTRQVGIEKRMLERLAISYVQVDLEQYGLGYMKSSIFLQKTDTSSELSETFILDANT